MRTGTPIERNVANLKQLKGRKERVRCHSLALYLGVKMDGTIDTLNIQITADTQKAKESVTSLKTALSNLDTALGSFRNLGTFANAMSGISESINEFSSAINSIDASKVQSLANSMKTITSATRGLASGVNSLSFTQSEDEAKGFKQAIDEATNTIKKEFGIAKENVDGLRERIVALAKSTNALELNPGNEDLVSDFSSAYNELQRYIESTKRVAYQFSYDYGAVVEQIRSHNNKFGVNTRDVYKQVGTQYASLRNLFGQGFGIDKAGISFDTFMTEIKRDMPALAQTVDSVVTQMGGNTSNLGDQFVALAEIVNRYNLVAKHGYAVTSELNTSERGLAAATGSVVDSFVRLSQAEGQVATIGETKTVNAFHSLAEGIKQFESVNITNIGQITELSQAIKSLGYATSEKAITNMPKLTAELNKLITTLAKAPAVSSGVTSLVSALANFNNSMKTYNSSVKATTGSSNKLQTAFMNLGNGMKKTNTGFKGLASTIGKIYATYWLLFRVFSKLGEAINLSSQLTEVENVVNQTFGDMRGLVDDFAKDSINKFGMSELALKQYASRFQAMGTAMGITGSTLEATTGILGDAKNQYGKLTDSMAEMSVNLTKLTADMASFYDVEQSAVAEDLYSVFTGQTRSLRQYGIDLTEVNLKEWAMKKGLDANLDSMTQAQKAALRYAYTLDAARYAMGDFERTNNTWANQVRILKANLQQLAIVIGQGFINALKPLLKALNTALGAITSFATKVLNALGQIFGWKYEINLGGVTTELEDTAGYADDTASGLGKAADEAGELKNQLRGFDKLNVLTTDKKDKNPKNTGGNTTTPGGATDTSDLINAAKVGEGLMKSSIKNLEQLGEYISNSLSKAMESINWEKVYEKARGFGKGLADFLNGMFAGESGKRLFSNLGATIAGAINTSMYAVNEFAKNFKWDEFGENLAEGLNSFFRKWKPVLTAHTFYNTANGILDAIISALDHVDWKLIGTQVGKFLANLHWNKILVKMAQALGKAIGGIFEMVKFSFKEAPIETMFLTALAALKLTKTGKLIAGALVTKLFGKSGVIKVALQGVAMKIGSKLLWEGKTLAAILLDMLAMDLGVQASAITAALGMWAIPITIALGLTIITTVDNLTASKKEITDALGGDEWSEFKEKVEGSKEAVKQTSQALKNFTTDYQTAMSNVKTEGKNIDKLVESYNNLASKENLTNKEKAQLKNITEQLLSAVPELSKYYNEQTGKIDLTAKAIKNLADQKKQELKLNAYYEQLTTLYENHQKAVDNLKNTYKEYKQALSDSKAQQASLDAQLRSGKITASEHAKATEELANNTKTAADNFKGSIENVDKYNEKIGNLTDKLGMTKDDMSAFSTALNEGGTDAIEMATEISILGKGVGDADSKISSFSKNTSQNMANSKTNVSSFSKSANSDLSTTKSKTNDLESSLKGLKGETNMTGASGNIKNFASEAKNNLDGTKSSSDKTKSSISGLKNETNMSGASSNVKNFASDAKDSMNTVKSNTDSAKTSIDGAKKSTQNLLKYNNRTFTINTNKNPLDNLKQSLQDVFNGLKNLFDNYNNKTLNVNTSSSTAKKADGGVFKNGKWHNITQYASGGYPTTGQVFIARERGPELVGNLGGGTGVMNNNQIVSSVSDGVYRAVASAMRQYGGTNVNVSLEGDATGLFRTIQTESQRYANRTGRSPFPT